MEKTRQEHTNTAEDKIPLKSDTRKILLHENNSILFN